MKPLAFHIKNNIRLFWGLVITLIVIFGFAISFSVQVYQSQQKIKQYFNVWEDELGQELILNKDPRLLLKISSQLKDLEKTISHSYAQTSTGKFGETAAACHFEVQAPIHFSTLPAGHVGVCFSLNKTLFSSASSPIFLVTLMLSALLISIAGQRERKKANMLAVSDRINSIAKQVAHDIRGPLMALKTLSANTQELDDDKKNLLLGATERIHGIAEDLLQKSKTELGLKIVPIQVTKPQVCNLQKTLRTLMPELQIRWPSHVHIHMNDQAREDLLIALDAFTLQRLIANLVQNSVDAKKAGEDINITLSIYKKDSHAWLQLIDNGCGIEPLLIPAILEGQSIGKNNGNGLGLSHAKRTIENLGGQFEFTSKKDFGTQIMMKLPLVKT